MMIRAKGGRRCAHLVKEARPQDFQMRVGDGAFGVEHRRERFRVPLLYE